MRVLPMGPTAVIVEDVDDPAGWAAAFERNRPVGVVEVVPAARTVLVVAADERSLRALVDLMHHVGPPGGDGPAPAASEGAAGSAATVVIDVDYDGPDLDRVAAAVGMSPDDVVACHAGAVYRVAFCGFAPGFAYLTGLPAELHLPRRTTPRTRVPAGSVAIASEYSALYPTASPGGWHLLGSTTATVFDVDRDPPAVLAPGTTVRFVPR